MPQMSTCVKAYYHREYAVDSGASYHLVAHDDLTESESKTIRLLEEPMIMTTANGEIVADSEADIYVHSLEMFITAMVIPSAAPPLISVGKLAEENDIKFSWDRLHGPTLAKPDGTVVRCQLGINVPIIAVPCDSQREESTWHCHRGN